MIPMLIHQTAPSDRAKWSPVWEECQDSVARHFPGFSYKLWDDDDLEELIRTKYPWFLQHYLSYQSTIMRVDAARYFILNTYGGIYIDMDYEVCRNFYDDLPQDRLSLVESPFTETEKHQNSLMASPPKHPLWNEVFRELMFTYDHYKESVLDATGPRMLDRVVERTDTPVHVLPSNKYNPRPHTNAHKDTTDLYTRHYYTAVWV